MGEWWASHCECVANPKLLADFGALREQNPKRLYESFHTNDKAPRFLPGGRRFLLRISV